MTERKKIEALLAAAADGEIGEADRVVLDAHLALHADDVQALADQRRVNAALAAMDAPAVGDAEWSRRWDVIAGELHTRPASERHFRIRWPIWLPTAVAAAIGLAVIWWVTAGPVTAATAAPIELATPDEATIETVVVSDENAMCMIMQPSESCAAVIWITDNNGQEDDF